MDQGLPDCQAGELSGVQGRQVRTVYFWTQTREVVIDFRRSKPLLLLLPTSSWVHLDDKLDWSASSSWGHSGGHVQQCWLSSICDGECSLTIRQRRTLGGWTGWSRRPVLRKGGAWTLGFWRIDELGTSSWPSGTMRNIPSTMAWLGTAAAGSGWGLSTIGGPSSQLLSDSLMNWDEGLCSSSSVQQPLSVCTKLLFIYSVYSFCRQLLPCTSTLIVHTRLALFDNVCLFLLIVLLLFVLDNILNDLVTEMSEFTRINSVFFNLNLILTTCWQAVLCTLRK